MVQRRRLWIILFIVAAVLLGTLAAGWNFLLIYHYHRMVELARSLSRPQESTIPWTIVTIGSVGFAALLATTILFFIKILREMRLNQLQSEFLAAVSHELKTPIASMELCSSLIRAGGLQEDEYERLWKTHERELKRLREDVEAILQAARLQAQPVMSRPRPISLEKWLADSMPRWRQMLGSDAVLLRKGDPLDNQVRLDVKALNLITDNLIDNSRKFARGTPKVSIITRRVKPQGFFKRPYWQIRFKDEGRGFRPSESKKIFNRFFRARHGAPHAIPGTGLGLYLASSACKAMGISISASSRGLGKGAVFTLKGMER